MKHSNLKKIIQGGLTIFLISLICLPGFLRADGEIPTPPSDGSGKGVIKGITYICNNGAPGECTFNDVVEAIKHIVNWGIQFALLFSIIIIAYAGYLYMISGDSPGERAKANKMFVSVAKGIFFALGAWLIVTLITNALLNDDINTFLG
jgi:hypothetical protein